MSLKRKNHHLNNKHNRNSKVEPHHEFSIYRTQPIDFKELAVLSTEFKEAWRRLKEQRLEKERRKSSNESFCFSTHVDFSFNLSLTRSLLLRDFGLVLPNFPEGHLVPPVCNRLNYVCWIRELLNLFQENNTSNLDDGDVSCRGLDIGTGVSCIYPLLLASARNQNKRLLFCKKWIFHATDIDPESIASAQENVEKNNLSNRIKLSCVSNENNSSKGPLQMAIDAFMLEISSLCDINDDCCVLYDFMMTNPPFYSNETEAFGQRKGDNRSRTDMSSLEGIYDQGGELGFVKAIFKDSVHLGNKIRWYSSMFGRKANAIAMEKFIRDTGLEWCNVKTTAFVQGKTTRWGLAWTHIIMKPRSKAAKHPIESYIFTVSVGDEVRNTRDLYASIFERVSVFCNEYKNVKLCCQFCSYGATKKIVIFERKNQSSSEMYLPPCSRNFLVDIIMKQSECDKEVKLELISFCYTNEGIQAAKQIREAIPPELMRTNRKWKRKKKQTEKNG